MLIKLPTLKEEKKLWARGYKYVIGLDEAGRGPLAGPIVAAAVCFLQTPGVCRQDLRGINDSKKLSEKQREFFYNILTKRPDLRWGVGIVSEKLIDKINILQATKLAMKKSLCDIGLDADFLLIDGNFKINYSAQQKPIIKGDQKVFSIAAASIIAKVTRDRLMQKYHKKYPHYGFDMHKGYGTKAHFVNLEKFGPCKIHRKTFYPVNTFSN